MKRLFWFGAGVVVGVVGVRLVKRQLAQLRPSGIADTALNQVGGVLGSVRDFIADVRDGMVDREAELREPWDRLGVDDPDWDDDEGAPLA